MRELRLNIASEYLVMAATLVHMKSLRLLPRLPTLIQEEEEEDPAAALARKLLEYQRFKEAAMDLDARPMVARDVFVRTPGGLEPAAAPIEIDISAFGLLEVYYELIKQHQAGPPVHAIGSSGPDMVACCRLVLDYLGGVAQHADLGRLLQTIADRSERVVAFIAVLEMVKLGWMDIQQKVHLGPVSIEKRPDAQVDLDILAGRIRTLDERVVPE